MRIAWLFGVLGVTLGSVSGAYGGTVAADWAQEMTSTTTLAGWGGYTGNISTTSTPFWSKRVDGNMVLNQTGTGTWKHLKTDVGGQIAPRSDSDSVPGLPGETEVLVPWSDPGNPTYGVGPLGTGLQTSAIAINTPTNVMQYTVDIRLKITNYNWNLLVDGDGDSMDDSNGDGDPAYDPWTFDNNNPGLPEAPAAIGGDFNYGDILTVFAMGRNGSHGSIGLGFNSHGFNLDENGAIISAKQSFTAGERYTGSFMSLTNNTGNDVRFGAEPGVSLPHIDGIDLRPGGGVVDQWRILRLQSTVNAEGKNFTSPALGVWQGRLRALLGDDTGQNWVELGDVDSEVTPNTPRDRSIYLSTGTGNVNGDGTVGKADIEFDYMRISYAAIPDSVLIGPTGAGTGNIILNANDVTRLEIGGNPVENTTFKTNQGTDYDVIRTRKLVATLQNSVTLAGTVNFIGSTREGGAPQELDPMGNPVMDVGANDAGLPYGILNDDRRYILPDIGQGPSRTYIDEFGDPQTLVVNPANHRGKKITRKGVVKAATVSGSFSTVQYGGVAASVLAEKGLFVKAVGFTNRADTDQRSTGSTAATILAHSGVDFVLLNAKLGDADGDEIVSSSDVFTALGNLGAATVGEDWNRGNFDGDNLVSSGDVFTALGNLGAYTPTAIADISSVPEPSSALLLLSFLAIGGVTRRRV